MNLFKSKIALIFYTLFISFVIGELTIRIISKSDLDENNFVFNVQLKPYKLPIKETERKLKLYENNKHESRLVFDKKLGWLPHQNFTSNNEMYIYDKHGVRSQSISDSIIDDNSYKILLFGDSYLHGDEVFYSSTIGAKLEKMFISDSRKVEVINYAVSGYGMDQAFLRWEEVKSKVKPDLVLFGIQFENVKRNINIYRPLYSPITEIPFSKPRFRHKNYDFVLSKNPTDNFSNILTNLSDPNRINQDGFYNPNNYLEQYIYKSELISFVSSATSLIFDEQNYYTLEGESSQITLNILERFRDSVENEKGQLIFVHLPVVNDFSFSSIMFSNLIYGHNFIYEELLKEIKNRFEFIEIYPQFENWIQNYSSNKLFMQRHYSPKTNELIAEEIFNYLSNNNILNKGQ